MTTTHNIVSVKLVFLCYGYKNVSDLYQGITKLESKS